MRQRILIIDDDQTDLHSARHILESDGYEVLLHDDPAEIRRHNPHLVLLDVNMRGLSAERLADVYRANAAIRNTRVMLYSSNDEATLREASTRLQLDGYICKGDPAALRVDVASVLAR